MDEQTTTEAPVDNGAQAQPESTEQPSAVEQTNQEPTQQEQPKPEPSDDDTSEWLRNKGIDPSDPDAITKLAKSAREAERAMHEKAKRASELEKTLSNTSDEVAEQVAEQTGQDPELVKRLQRIEVRDAVRDFFDSNPQAKEHEQKMVEILAKKPHLAGDLESLYATALVQSGTLDSVKSQGKQEALRNLAQKQQATAPTGNATTSGAPKQKPFNELSIAEMEAQLGFARR